MEYSFEEIRNLTEKVRKYAMVSVSQSRYEHSERTAEMCVKLCSLFGLDENLGYLAGISHDMCKKMDEKSLLEYAKQDGEPISDLELEKPALLHGRAAAIMLEKDFDFHDKRIVEAVAVHTFGKVGMCDYSKVLFVADKIEPGREHITEEYLEEVYALPLNRIVEKVLSENISYLERKGKKVAPESERLLAWIESV